jgi:trehalose/maltose hydrolase-like predicted phosphorylase
VLMLFYLLAPGQVAHVLELMGYQVGDGRELLRRNYEYYVRRTSHGSTLSWVVHSAILRYLDGHQDDQWRWFVECLKSDVHDTQGGTTLEGIHCGVMAGSIDIVLSGFVGLHLFRDRISIDPRLPDDWQRVVFRIVHHGERMIIEAAREEGEMVAYITRLESTGARITACHGENELELPVGERVRVRCPGDQTHSILD